jgi:hypothetical protein
MRNTHLYLFLLIFFLSCNEVEKSKETNTTQANTAQGSTYNYYPRANIYYDIEQKHYLVFDSAQNLWQQKTSLSTEENALLTKKVVINNPSLPIYEANDHHRLIYGTALYSSAEEIRKKFIEDSLKIVNAKKKRLAADSLKMSNGKKDTTIGKKRKNGLKNFFDKIFKKKSEKPLPPAK